MKVKGARGYGFGSLKETISAFEKYEKVDLEIDTHDEPDAILELAGDGKDLYEKYFTCAPHVNRNNNLLNYH